MDDASFKADDNLEQKTDPSPPTKTKISSAKRPSGSFNSDDSDRPRWGWDTKPLERFDYRNENGWHAFYIDKGQNPDGEKVFRSRRLNLIPFGERTEPEDKVDEFPGLGDVQPLLYRLPELKAADQDRVIFVVEGEKDVDRLHALGEVETTNPFGAGTWLDAYSDYLTDRDVVILPDNDERGRAHAEKVLASLHRKARSVSVIELPGLPATGDVSDWLDAGHTLQELMSLVVGADPSTPQQAPRFSEEALALQFAEQHCATLRYVNEQGRWMNWTGSRWQIDQSMFAFDLSRAICRQNAMLLPAKSGGRSLASAKTVAAVVKLAQADRRLVALIDQWDTDPWLLNTPGGIVDLKTGELLPARPDAFMTKISAVAPGGDCPVWRSHIGRVTGGDRELEGFVQRMFGYALTGSTDEHALFFLYGTGANGKSVTLDTIAGVMGDYQRTAPVETFTESRGEHPTDLANLMGARMVNATETEEGRRWAESRIKALTGGGTIAARFMRQDFFEFVPQFKLIIAGNHKPGLRNVDVAMRRRLHLVPFTVTIPPEDRNLSLKDELRAEWPGILQWMIEGCREWQRTGLKPPSLVTSATDDYLESEDLPALWLEECCERDPKAWTQTSHLYSSWNSWAKDGNEYPISKRRFSQKLVEMGFKPSKRGGGNRGFVGLKLRPDGGAM